MTPAISSRRHTTAGFFGLVLLALAAAPASAAATNPTADAKNDAVFVLGGRYQNQFFEYSFNPFAAHYEDNYILGGGYQHFFYNWSNAFRLGAEVGADLRFGDSTSGEAWAGLVGRYDGFQLGDVRVSPAFTFGLSAETGTVGVERERKAENHGDPTVLFYMGPELDVSMVDYPDTEVFYRVQHRSGAWGTLGGFSDGANAITTGVRWHF